MCNAHQRTCMQHICTCMYVYVCTCAWLVVYVIAFVYGTRIHICTLFIYISTHTYIWIHSYIHMNIWVYILANGICMWTVSPYVFERSNSWSSKSIFSGRTKRNWEFTSICRFISQVLQMKCDRRRMELLEAAAHEEQKCHTQILLIDVIT